MSIRRISQKSGSGKVYEFLMIDVTYVNASGKRIRVRKAAEIQNVREAKREEAQILTALQGGTYSAKPSKQLSPGATTAPKFRDFAVEFIERYSVATNKVGTVMSRTVHLEHHLLPVFGDHRIDEITTEDVEEFRAARIKAGAAKGTVNNSLSTLNAALNRAVKWGRMSKASLPEICLLRRPDSEVRFLDFGEAERLITHGGEWSTLYLVAIRTGLRAGELRALRWCDVSFINAVINVRRNLVDGPKGALHYGTPKSGKSRIVDLSPDTVTALKRHQHLRKGEDLVFSFPDGTPLNRNYIRTRLAKACRRANLEPMGIHTLRHTFASHLTMRGCSLKVVQELMGHSSIVQTMVYSHLSPSAKQDAVRLLDASSGA